MARDDVVHVEKASWLATNPWPTLVGGLGAVLVSLIWFWIAGSTLTPARVLLMLAGLVSVGLAVAIRFRVAEWNSLDERLVTGAILALAALAALLANLGVESSWDTVSLLLRVFVLLALVGAGLTCLSRGWRRAAISLLVVFHFGGILAAVTSVPAPRGTTPWITQQLWSHVYHPYLEFMHLGNAYHFYSPDPGPPTLLWFYIDYEDGSTRKEEIPRRESFRTRLEFQRRLALTERITEPGQPPSNFQELLDRRIRAGQLRNIPLNPIEAPGEQYYKPSQNSVRLLQSYVRHVAQNYPSPTDPSMQVRSIRVYRVTHKIIWPQQLAMGFHATDTAFYEPIYYGKYDAQGDLLEPNDPFLYWVIPVFLQPKTDLSMLPRPQRADDFELYNYMETHAASSK